MFPSKGLPAFTLLPASDESSNLLDGIIASVHAGAKRSLEHVQPLRMGKLAAFLFFLLFCSHFGGCLLLICGVRLALLCATAHCPRHSAGTGSLAGIPCDRANCRSTGGPARGTGNPASLHLVRIFGGGLLLGSLLFRSLRGRGGALGSIPDCCLAAP